MGGAQLGCPVRRAGVHFEDDGRPRSPVAAGMAITSTGERMASSGAIFRPCQVFSFCRQPGNVVLAGRLLAHRPHWGGWPCPCRRCLSPSRPQAGFAYQGFGMPPGTDSYYSQAVPNLTFSQARGLFPLELMSAPTWWHFRASCSPGCGNQETELTCFRKGWPPHPAESGLRLDSPPGKGARASRSTGHRHISGAFCLKSAGHANTV